MDLNTKVQQTWEFTANYGKRRNCRQTPKFAVSVNSASSWFSSSRTYYQRHKRDDVTWRRSLMRKLTTSNMPKCADVLPFWSTVALVAADWFCYHATCFVSWLRICSYFGFRRYSLPTNLSQVENFLLLRVSLLLKYCKFIQVSPMCKPIRSTKHDRLIAFELAWLVQKNPVIKAEKESGFCQFHDLRERILHQRTKFQPNRTSRGWVIDYFAHFHRLFFFEGRGDILKLSRRPH